MDLLKKAVSGCEDSIAAIYEIAERVAKSVIRGTSAKRLGNDEDIVQDSLFDIARDLDRCSASNELEFEAWVARIVRNNVSTAWTKRNTMKRTAPGGAVFSIGYTDEDSACTDVPCNSLLSPLDEVVKREMIALAKEVLESIEYEGNNRQAIDLYLDGYSVPEIAKIIGSTPQAVSGVVKRTRKKLREACHAHVDNS